MLSVFLLLSHGAAMDTLDLSNWMGQLSPILGNATLLDLSLPGTHDSMTYDLSDTLSDGYEGWNPFITKILHGVTPIAGGRFVRRQGQTQGISVTEMLDGGIRFIDFRIMYTQGPDKAMGSKDWYCLHGCESKRKAIDYLKQIRQWLDQHPKELVVLWASRHGSTSACGTDQFPDTTPAERQAFFKEVKDVFGGMLFSQSLNETSLVKLQESNQRLVWFASDYLESTGGSEVALDAQRIENRLVNNGYGVGAMKFFRQGGAAMKESRAKGHFLLVSLAGGMPKQAIEDAAKISFLPDAFGSHKKWEKDCAASSSIPNMTVCPQALMEWGLLANYYNQKVLDLVYSEGSSSFDVDFPNAIYLDAVDLGGLIRTGTAKINPLEEAGQDEHATDGYAYAATLIAANVRRLCRGKLHDCSSFIDQVEVARRKNPLSLWEDVQRGRLPQWPELKNAVVVI
eukprot:Skav229455  [mRNA]  locus=scaffold397:326805:328169:+ [translate_table: standard]